MAPVGSSVGQSALYIDMGFGHRIEKYVPKPNADRSRLVGQPMK
jgi:hypothetical protein